MHPGSHEDVDIVVSTLVLFFGYGPDTNDVCIGFYYLLMEGYLPHWQD